MWTGPNDKQAVGASPLDIGANWHDNGVPSVCPSISSVVLIFSFQLLHIFFIFIFFLFI